MAAELEDGYQGAADNDSKEKDPKKDWVVDSDACTAAPSAGPEEDDKLEPAGGSAFSVVADTGGFDEDETADDPDAEAVDGGDSAVTIVFPASDNAFAEEEDTADSCP